MSIRSISVSTGIFSPRAISRRQSQNWFSRDMDVLLPASLIECLSTGECGLRRALRSGVESTASMDNSSSKVKIVQFSEMCRPKSSWTQGQCLLLTQRGHRDGYHGHGWSYSRVVPMYG